MSNKEFDNFAAFEDKERKDKEEWKKQKEKIEKESRRNKERKEKNDFIEELKKKLIDMRFDIENSHKANELYSEVVNLLETWKITEEEIKEIFEKIDEIIELNEKKENIPKSLLFDKEEYLKALENNDERKKLLKKIDNILTYTSDKLQPLDNFFMLAWYYFLLDKDIQIVHDNCIDVKENLEKLD